MMTKKLIEMTNEVEIDKGYELYQIIQDFDNPVQIFREAFQNCIDEDATEVYCHVHIDKQLGLEDLYLDIWDNGKGLKKENIDSFFGLAKSTKVNKNKTPKAGKLGYKGHGTKIFFNSERVEIISRVSKKEEWGAVLDQPVKQIRDTGTYKYSDFLQVEELDICLPREYPHGFFVRIKNPHYFKTKHTQYMLNHMYLRDYAKWYTVFGNIRTSISPPKNEVKLFIKGLSFESFKDQYTNLNQIDPLPEYVRITDENDQITFIEKLKLGHYFPEQRYTDVTMKNYAKTVGHNKPYYDYYSKEIYNSIVYLDNDIKFHFLIYTEGYETKRRYDILLSRKSKSAISQSLIHTDGERYGFWACKGGVPIEKVDDWIEGGRGVGTYTYIHAFIDCDHFELTANRGSVRNTDLEIIEKVKAKVNEILNEKSIQKLMKDRQDWEEFEKTMRSVNEDEQELKERFKETKNRKTITLPNGSKLIEPTKNKSGYNESETAILLVQLIAHYPDLFPFIILDYNTTKGIDFVIKRGEFPRYVELKGTMQKKVNHSFRNVNKFICYDIEIKNDEIITDVEGLEVKLKVNDSDRFNSFDETFKNKEYTSFILQPNSAVIDSMEIIVLKNILTQVLNAKL